MTSTALSGASGGEPRVLLETSRALPLVSLAVALKSGAFLDAPGKEGTTRLLSRLMRRTGGGLDPQQLDTRIDSLGGSLGADVAQSTAVFQGTIISRSLEPFVELMLDVLARPGLAEAELERLQRETLAELKESLDDDRGLVRRWFRRRFFAGHPYGRSIGGSERSVAAIRPSDVTALYARAFVRENLLFAFSGDVTGEQASGIAGRVASALPSGEPPRDETVDPVAVPGRRLVIVDKPERTQTQILIGCLGTHPYDDDHLPLLVANTIFGGTFTARMTQEVRSKRGWSYGAYSNLPIDRRRQAFTMWTFPKAEDAAPCVKLELEMLRAFREKGVTAKELSWARRYLLRSHAFAIDTAQKRVGMALDAALYDLPEGYNEKYLERISAVTLEQANAAVANRLSDENLLVTVVGTESQIGAALRDAIPDLTSSEVVPYDSVD